MTIPTQASPMVQSSVPNMPEQAAMTPAAMSTTGEAKGIMAFVKKNPAVAALGAGASQRTHRPKEQQGKHQPAL